MVNTPNLHQLYRDEFKDGQNSTPEMNEALFHDTMANIRHFYPVLESSLDRCLRPVDPDHDFRIPTESRCLQALSLVKISPRKDSPVARLIPLDTDLVTLAGEQPLKELGIESEVLGWQATYSETKDIDLFKNTPFPTVYTPLLRHYDQQRITAEGTVYGCSSGEQANYHKAIKLAAKDIINRYQSTLDNGDDPNAFVLGCIDTYEMGTCTMTRRADCFDYTGRHSSTYSGLDCVTFYSYVFERIAENCWEVSGGIPIGKVNAVPLNDALSYVFNKNEACRPWFLFDVVV